MSETPDDVSVAAEPKQHPWSRSEVRFGALIVVLALLALVISHLVNPGHAAKGPAVGGMPPNAGAVYMNHAGTPHP